MKRFRDQEATLQNAFTIAGVALVVLILVADWTRWRPVAVFIAVVLAVYRFYRGGPYGRRR